MRPRQRHYSNPVLTEARRGILGAYLEVDLDRVLAITEVGDLVLSIFGEGLENT